MDCAGQSEPLPNPTDLSSINACDFKILKIALIKKIIKLESCINTTNDIFFPFKSRLCNMSSKKEVIIISCESLVLLIPHTSHSSSSTTTRSPLSSSTLCLTGSSNPSPSSSRLRLWASYFGPPLWAGTSPSPNSLSSLS